MLFGTTIFRPLCVVVLVVCLGRNVGCLEESFKLFRGKRDIFSNPKCSQPGGSNCRDSCDELAAECKDLDCSYCVCGNNDGKNTYMKNSSGHGRCVKDEKIAPCSGLFQCYTHFNEGIWKVNIWRFTCYLYIVSLENYAGTQSQGKQKVRLPWLNNNIYCLLTVDYILKMKMK